MNFNFFLSTKSNYFFFPNQIREVIYCFSPLSFLSFFFFFLLSFIHNKEGKIIIHSSAEERRERKVISPCVFGVTLHCRHAWLGWHSCLYFTITFPIHKIIIYSDSDVGVVGLVRERERERK